MVGDFGLAKRPDDPALTGDKPVGPKHLLPPEVFQPGEINWERVDVYCLAYTLWLLALERDTRTATRGQIRATEDDSLALLLPDEPHVLQLAGLIEGATSRSPASRPTLNEFAQQLTHWMAIAAARDAFVDEYEQAAMRKREALRWLVGHVRREPVFGSLGFAFYGDLSGPSQVEGLTIEQFRDALEQLIEDGSVHGIPDGRAITRIFPSAHGFRQVADLDALVAQATPLLTAYLEPGVMLQLHRTDDPQEVKGITQPPTETFLQLSLLADLGLMDFRRRTFR